VLIRLGCPQSAITLHIYRVGWSVPFRSRNPNKSCVKIQLLTRIGHFGQSDWSPNRSDRGADLSEGITSSPGLQIGHSTYVFRLSRWDLCNGAVQLAFWQPYPDQSDRFIQPAWPVHPDCPANLGICQFWVSTYVPLFLGKACIPRNISHSPKLHWNNEKHLRTNPALLSRVIL